MAKQYLVLVVNRVWKWNSIGNVLILLYIASLFFESPKQLERMLTAPWGKQDTGFKGG